MRHLINTYIQADPADDLGNLNSLSLTELIIETGVHDAIARKLNQKGKLSKNAIAEGIINNVRKTIIRDQLTDPRFYEEMSKLLDDLIKQSRADTAAYEAFLKKAEDLVVRLAKKSPAGGVPAVLHGKPEAIVLFNNLAAFRRRPSSAPPTRTTRRNWRLKSTRPCVNAHRQVGKATTFERSRCLTRFTRSWLGTAWRRRAFLRSSRTSQATDDGNDRTR
jgi:hypothetical protein